MIMCTAGNFLIYLFHFQIPLFLQLVLSLLSLKISVGVLNQMGKVSCKSKHDVCVHYVMELNQNIYGSTSSMHLGFDTAVHRDVKAIYTGQLVIANI